MFCGVVVRVQLMAKQQVVIILRENVVVFLSKYPYTEVKQFLIQMPYWLLSTMGNYPKSNNVI